MMSEDTIDKQLPDDRGSNAPHCSGAGGPKLPISLREWSNLNQRVGFLEGAMRGLRYTEDPQKSLDQIKSRYREMT